MNESVPLMANSLILTGMTFRTFSIVFSERVPAPASVHDALATRSPLKAAEPEVTLKVSLTVAPGATGLLNVISCVPVTTDSESHFWTSAVCQPLGAEMLNFTPVAGSLDVFLKVTVVSCEDPGENIWMPGGVLVAEAGARLNRAKSYLAATTLACTFWSVSSVGNVPAAVIAPS